MDALNTVAIEVAAAPDARILPRTAGIPDELFEHDGQISKREIRAVVLSSLAPRRSELLWDIGAGSGSVAIEAAQLASQGMVYAVEPEAGDLALIQANAEAFERAVDEVAEAARQLILSLHSAAPPRDRETEAQKARERSRLRFGSAP